MGEAAKTELGDGLFRAVFDACPRAMWLYDQERLAFIAVNDAACTLFGWSRTELLSMSIADLFGGAEGAQMQRLVEALEPSADATSSGPCRLRLDVKNGASVDVDVEVTRAVFDGRRVGLAGVTEASERAAHEAQRRLELVLSATSAVMYTANAFGDFAATFVSANVEAIVGHPPSAFLGTPTFWLDHIHPDDRQGVDDGLRRMLELGEHSFQYRFLHADGRFRWMQDAARVVYDADRRPREIVGYWIDVTERVHAEYALRGSEANFRALIEKAPGAIFVHRAGAIVYANSATVALLGHDSASGLVGRSVITLIHEGDREAVRLCMEKTIREGASPLLECRMLRRDGRVMAVEAEAVLLDFGGESSSVVLARDVTERREMFARVAAADRMRSVGMLAAGVAHEINNPLAYVTSNLALLAAELPSLLANATGGRLGRRDVEGLVRDSQEGAARVSGIVRDLLSFSRETDEATEPVDVGAVIDSCLKIAHSELVHRARVLTRIEPGLPRVQAHASRLAQVLLNLLVNAAQAIPEGDVGAHEVRLRACASTDARQVWIDVEDTGTGMAPGVLERIFDPFFTTKPVGVGTGLGLSISHHIVRSFGGEISVSSTPPRGSRFRVTLPAAAASATATATEPASGRMLAPVTPKRVLVVDDEPALARSLRLLLSPDYDVVAVTRAREALDLLVGGAAFDAVLCDLMMPEMSGMELHDELTRRAPEVVRRFVYMTGGAFTEEARRFLGCSTRMAIGKPFSEKELRLALDNVAVTASVSA